MTQKQIIIDYLRAKGEVSRNICIREHYITRLGAIIDSLKKKGYKFKTEERGGDYVYILEFDPTRVDESIYRKEVIEERLHNYHNPTLL